MSLKDFLGIQQDKFFALVTITFIRSHLKVQFLIIPFSSDMIFMNLINNKINDLFAAIDNIYNDDNYLKSQP